MPRKKCKLCDGTGKVLNPSYKGVVFFQPPHDYLIVCPDCNGTGERKRTR